MTIFILQKRIWFVRQRKFNPTLETDDFHEASFEVYYVSVSQKLANSKIIASDFFHFDRGHFQYLILAGHRDTVLSSWKVNIAENPVAVMGL